MLSLETPRKNLVPDFAAQRLRRWIGRCCTGRRTQSYRAHSNNNEFGLDNEKWDRELRQETLRLRNTRSDEAFLRTLERSQEWVDLELLLRELNELGARPLLLSMPIHGGWYDQCGVTYTARRAYYEKLRGISARYHVPVVDFADHDADRSFCRDPMGHLAPSGWVYYDQVFDGFFHDAIALQSELPAPRRSRAGRPEEDAMTHSWITIASAKVTTCPSVERSADGHDRGSRFVTLTIYYLGILVVADVRHFYGHRELLAHSRTWSRFYAPA